MLGTLCLLAQVSHEEVQSPESLSAEAGDSVSISCTGTSGVCLTLHWASVHDSRSNSQHDFVLVYHLDTLQHARLFWTNCCDTV
ncbi:hypothetical protein G5714_018807 [Onychostoma macrolepis]|uniref:Immunoglobulin V-set domain-containing protein n=1 Tax=Onychostoma macrolepis TaxID=369639 RepID=A0A7J6C0M1_9TELE|nr:hypothetical protein G5714_018807 [Onychostoma macrolepis]